MILACACGGVLEVAGLCWLVSMSTWLVTYCTNKYNTMCEKNENC